jgi:GLPGLI family protein
MKYVLFLVLSSLLSSSVISQNFELTYTASFDKELMIDKLNQSKKELKDKATTRRLFRESKPIEIKIITDSKTAYSFRENQLESDHVKININNAHYGKEDNYYLNLLERKYVFKKNPGSKEYYVSFQPYDYVIKNKELKLINGFKCQSAYIEGEDTKVWFTTDKPLNIGPKTYIGFPGLVVKVQKAEVIVYELKSIKETQIEPKKLPKDQEVISEKQYNEIIKQMSKGIFED